MLKKMYAVLIIEIKMLCTIFFLSCQIGFSNLLNHTVKNYFFIARLKKENKCNLKKDVINI